MLLLVWTESSAPLLSPPLCPWSWSAMAWALWLSGSWPSKALIKSPSTSF